ncbi:pyridoxamine 5'-phosphate oxidase-related protein, FMN-binding protein [Roseibacterium elongatum DSM 19469]|uniref:Pyridoxamine 5'-phosphate oxidase-related protein, FMN-binding protein n=1 Tax=Roseicyclus elongatus DSM 19469 TaxID=1294273 RepID=W8RQK6_9RHOB|nr:pyridoxamine 5'-phosphate oxidase family protein [Roseibacterium elongatum]AHM03414.1 pyridoxamine 5'-phosphate oxidase-related protein, FMN-binding protein [Roseibacterium elongatum DSM 19469]
MSEQTLTGMFDMVWGHLSRGVSDRRHPARHPTLATIGPDGPDMRTLVLRAAHRDSARLDLHTDAASPKYAQIRRDPLIALHVWIPKARLQIRARGLARLEPGDPALFAALPPEAQANYGGPAPGTAGPHTQPPTPDASRFALIRCQVTQIDALLLADPHQRALYTAETGWQGQWIAP